MKFACLLLNPCLLLKFGRCYVVVKQLALRYAIAWHPFLLKSKFSISGQKSWTIVHGFIFGVRNIMYMTVDMLIGFLQTG